MKLCLATRTAAEERGSVLVLVLWISFGLVVLALYFADAMNFEMRTADNRVAAVEAEHAINGAARYVSRVLKNYATNGAVPDLRYYASQDVAVGDATFWLIGRAAQQGYSQPTVPAFGLIDEASKLNLNSTNVTADMLAALPGMTLELAAAIIDWRDADGEPGEYGAEDETYQRLVPPRRCKNAPFETVDELRLVYGATLDILSGEDVNRNDLLDLNENDGDISPPSDNRDGRLYPGLFDYVTIYSRQPNTRADGSARVNVNSRQQLASLLQQTFDAQRSGQIIAQLGPAVPPIQSVLEFYARSGMTADEFARIESDVTASSGSFVEGLVNVNTASEAVLACIPGIGTTNAPSLVAYRLSNPDRLTSMAWVKNVLDDAAIRLAGRYLTGQAYQFTADVAALGHHDRGFRRAKFVFDNSEGTPRIVYRQDLTTLGWPLGRQIREDLKLARNRTR